jgi:hypothetical protein
MITELGTASVETKGIGFQLVDNPAKGMQARYNPPNF